MFDQTVKKFFIFMSIIPFVLFGESRMGEDAPSCCCSELYCGGFWLGVNYASYIGGDWALMAGWSNEHFLAELGYSFEHIKSWSLNETFNVHELRTHLGFRYRFPRSNLFFTYGALASYGFRSRETKQRRRPYGIGAFIGLDYHLTRHFLISGKIAPYTYERSFTRNRVQRAFAEGSITLAYVF